MSDNVKEIETLCMSGYSVYLILCIKLFKKLGTKMLIHYYVVVSTKTMIS